MPFMKKRNGCITSNLDGFRMCSTDVKKYPRILPYLLVTAFVSFAAAPAYPEILVVDEDAAAAMAAATDAATARLRVDAAAGERRVGTANNFLLPSLTASVAAAEKVVSGADATASGVVKLSSGLSLSAADFQAKTTVGREAAALRLQAQAAADRIGRDARVAFYRLILLSQRVRLAEGAVEIAREGAERTAEEYRNGLSSERVKRQSEVSLAIEKLALERVRTEAAVAEAYFRSLLGVAEGTELSFSGSLETPEISVDAALAADLSRRNDLALIAARLAVQESLRAEDRLGRRYPALSLSATASSEVADLSSGAGGSLSDRAVSGASFTVTLSSPNLAAFLPFSKEAEKSASLADAEAKLRLEGADLTRVAKLEVESLLAKLAVSRIAIASLTESLALAAEVVELTREAYAVGAASYQDLRTAETDLDQARVDEAAERFTYLSTIIDLEYAVGRRLRPAKE